MSTAKIVQLCEHHHRIGRVIERKMRGGIPSEGGFHAQSHAKSPFDLLPTDANFFDGAPNAHSYRVDPGFGRCVDRGRIGKSDNRPTAIPSRPRKHINID
jgi:hypothetical protein